MSNIVTISQLRKQKLLFPVLFILVFGFQLINYQNNDSVANVNNDAIELKTTPVIRLSDNIGQGSFLPEIATDSSGNVHVVWEDNSANDVIFYRKYFRNNDSWSDKEILSNITENRHSRFPIIKIDTKDNIHVLWRDSGFFVPSTLNYRHYNGRNWSDIEIVSEVIDVTFAHDLVSFNNTTFIIWNNESVFEPYELYYKQYNRINKSWSTTTQLTNSNHSSIAPKMAIDSEQKIHLVWVDSSNTSNGAEIFYQYFSNNSWHPQEPLIVSTIDEIYSSRPSITTSDEELVHVVWQDSTYPIDEIHYRSIHAGNLSEDQLISGELQFGLYPASCSDEAGNVHIVWYENEHINYKRRDASGDFSKTFNVTTNEPSFLIIFPKIAVYKNEIHIVWNDYLKDNSWEVYYIKSKLLFNNRLIFATLIPINALLLIQFLFVVIFKVRKRYDRK